MAPKLTAKEKTEALSEILGVKVGAGALKGENEEKLIFSDNIKTAFRHSYTEEIPDKEDPENGTAFDLDDEDPDDKKAPAQEADDDKEEATATGAQDDDMPTWAKVLLDKDKDRDAELRASRMELQTMREFLQKNQRDSNPVVPPVQGPEIKGNTELDVAGEAYWVDSSHLDTFKKELNGSLQLVNQVAFTQERSLFSSAIANLKAQRPDFDEVIPPDVQKKAFDMYSQDPKRYGGFGRDWTSELLQLYKLNNHDRLEARMKNDAAKQDEVSKKRDEKQTTQRTNQKQVPRSGAAVQEPQLVRQKGVRDYKHPSVRNAALKLFS